MSYLQHSFSKNRKGRSAAAPYCRHADWWKNASDQPRQEKQRSRYSLKSEGYQLYPKRKINWSILYIPSGGQTLTDSEKKFRHFSSEWKSETGHYSVVAKRYENKAYKAILAMDKDAIPFILKELRRNPDRWFSALEKLSGENPAKESVNFYEAVDRWIAWGIANEYIT